MLGVVLLSEYNELVHAFGNSQFRQHFFAANSSYSEGNGQLSSSSGVSSTAFSAANTPDGRHHSRENIHGEEEGEEPALREEEDQGRDQSHREEVEVIRRNGDNGEDGTGTMRKPSFTGNIREEEDEPQLEETLLLSQLMPLVALCRTRAAQHPEDGHQIECIQSGTALQIRVANLPFSNLLVLLHTQSIFPDETASESLFHSLIRCLNFHYGPQLQLVTIGSELVQQLRRRCEQRMFAILAGMDDDEEEGKGTGNAFDVITGERHFSQDLFFGGTHRFVQAELVPRLDELTRLVAQRVGRRCRCLFFHSDHLMASTSSQPPGESVLTSLPPGQLLSMLQFARQADDDGGHVGDGQGKGRRRSPLKCQTEQTWLHSKTLRRPQLHNLFVLSLSERLEMVCFAPAEHSQVVGSLCECLELLEQLGNDHSVELTTSLLDKCQRHLDCALRLLMDAFGQRSFGWEVLAIAGGWASQQWDYLQDMDKTGELLQQLWTRFRTSLDRVNLLVHLQANPRPFQHVHRQHQAKSCPSPSPCSSYRLSASSQSLLTDDDDEGSSTSTGHKPEQCNNNSTISSVYSTLEWSSLSAATCSSTSHPLTVQLDSMRGQLKRVLRALLNELLSWSSGLASTQTLPRLQAAIRQFMGLQLARTFSALEQEMAKRWPQGRNPLRPALLGLDMLAFRFAQLNGPPLHFQFAGEEPRQRELFAQLLETFPLMGAGGEAGDEHWGEAKGRAEEEMFIGRTSDGQLVLQFTHCLPQAALDSAPAKKKTKLFPSLRGLLKASGGQSNARNAGPQQQKTYQALVLFSRHVNLALALKQAQTLTNVLAEQMEQCVPSFR